MIIVLILHVLVVMGQVYAKVVVAEEVLMNMLMITPEAEHRLLLIVESVMGGVIAPFVTAQGNYNNYCVS